MPRSRSAGVDAERDADERRGEEQRGAGEHGGVERALAQQIGDRAPCREAIGRSRAATARRSQSRYCVTIGRSSPSSARTLARDRAGSSASVFAVLTPGAARVRRQRDGRDDEDEQQREAARAAAGSARSSSPSVRACRRA